MTAFIFRPGAPAQEYANAREARTHLTPEAGVAWVPMTDPTPAQLDELARMFTLPAAAVAHVINGGNRSKLEDHGEVLFLALRHPRTPTDLTDSYVFAGPNFVIHVARDGAGTDLRRRIDADRQFRTSVSGLVCLVLGAVVESYEPALEHMTERIDDVEDDVFAGASGVAQRLHELLNDVLRYQRALHALVGISEQLLHRVPQDLHNHLRGIHHHARQQSMRIEGCHDVLSSAMQVHIALVGQRQNEEVARLSQATYEQGEQAKKIASWAAILFTPTVIAGVYGMNFRHMPELATRYGYPVALLAMFGAAVALFLIFKRQKWL